MPLYEIQYTYTLNGQLVRCKGVFPADSKIGAVQKLRDYARQFRQNELLINQVKECTK